jgi:sulfatase modifying factor 1
VSAPSFGRRLRGAVSRKWLWAFGASLGTVAACAQIVGITDTQVTSGQEGGLSDTGGGEALGDVIAVEGATDTGGGAMPGEGGNDVRPPADTGGGPEGSPAGDGSQGVDGSKGADASEGGDANQRADTSQGGDTGQSPIDASADQGSVDAGTLRGPTMVKVGAFYVDSTEVTVAQYQQFLAAKGTDTSGQPSVCAWNTTYYDSSVPLNSATWPMTNVDWCDALAYCTWAGKHLCGTIGGGPIARADVLTASKSQWYLACGGPGNGTHPNSNPVCNSSMGFGNLAPVATFPNCEGFYAGLFDMEGNAAEWVDSCDSTDAGATDTCHLLGGSYIDGKSYCTEAFDYPRNTSAQPFGFRCCAG